MFERFTEPARQVVVLAQEEARGLGHEHIGTEHLLLGVLREEGGIGAQVLGGLGITVAGVRDRVVEIVGSSGPGGATQIPFVAEGKAALEAALREALALGHNYIGTEHLLLALPTVAESTAARILESFGVEAAQIRAAVHAALPEGRSAAAVARRAGMAARAAAHAVRYRIQVDPSPEVRRLLMRAAACALEDGREQMLLADLLIGLARDPAASALLAELGIDEPGIRRALTRRQADAA